jgi:hypothetical protein
MIIDVIPEYKEKFQKLFATIETISTGISG